LKERNQNIYITSDEEIKEGDCCIENGMYISNGSSSPVSDTLYQKESKKSSNNRPKLNQRECKPLMMSFWVVRKESSVRRWRYFIKMFILWVNGIEKCFQKIQQNLERICLN
jgi:hypothetical protein